MVGAKDREGPTRVAVLLALALAPAPATRAANHALDFQQLNAPYVKDHLRLSAHPAVGDELTVEFWIRPDASIPFCDTAADPQGCWSTGNTWFYGNFIFDGHQNFEQNPGRDSFDVVVANSGRLKVVIDPGTAEIDGATDVVSGGGWRHVAVVREWVGAADHRVRLFVDGVLDGEALLGGRPSLQLIFSYWGTERADWQGAGPDDFPDYHGQIDEIRYWGVARTAEEIQGTMNTELTGNEPGLVHYLRLNESSGRIAHDMRGDNDGIFFDLQAGSRVPSTAPLTPAPGPDCGDGELNQGEIGVDCGGPCFPCPPLAETDCTDGVDEDYDGPADCDDADCLADAACQTPDGVFAVAADDRDADWNPVEGVMLGNFFNRSQVCVGRDGARTWQLGLQFPIALPLPVTVTSARLILRSSGDNAGTVDTTVRAIDLDDLVPFVAGPAPSFTSSYPLLADAIAWQPPAGAVGATAESPELAPLVQQVLDRAGFLPGSQLGLILTESTADGVWRCFADRFAGDGNEATLEIAFYAHGSPVCLDARGAEDDFRVTREPPGGCPLAPGGIGREFVFGDVSALAAGAGFVELGTVRCAGGPATTEEVVRSADPDLPAGVARFYLWRPVGAPDFGEAALAAGPAPRVSASAVPCP